MKTYTVENVEIIDIADKGKAIGKQADKVFLVENAVPGDLVDLQVVRKRKGMFLAKVINLKKASEHRVNSFCHHFEDCGGCKWQHLDYQEQLKFKQKQVTDSFTRIAKIELPSIPKIIPSPKLQHYRNKLEFSFSNKKWIVDKEDIGNTTQHNALGFHVAGRFDKVLDIDSCYLQHDLQNKIRNFVRDFVLKHDYSFYDLREQHGLMRNIIIRNTKSGEWMVIVVFGTDDIVKIKNLLSVLQNEFPEITSLLYIINEKKNDSIYDLDVNVYGGNNYITESLLGLNFKISPKAFFQPNMYQSENLYKVALDFANLTDSDTVYDLYCGTGTITCLAAKSAGKAIGIESVPEAITDAQENAKINRLGNTHFIVGDMKEVLNEDMFSTYGKPDVLIVDPPRIGMHKEVVHSVINSNVDKIVYVSCNPSTQARDVEILKEHYTLEKIQAVDMFPYTSHVENVILLKRK